MEEKQNADIVKELKDVFKRIAQDHGIMVTRFTADWKFVTFSDGETNMRSLTNATMEAII